MASITILALNTRGLNCPTKRASLLNVLDHHNIDLALLNETHIARSRIPRLEDKRYKVLSHSSAINTAKGVLIMARRSLPLSIIESGGDVEGRITYIKTLFGKVKIVFVAIYAPTPFDPDFFPQLTELLLEFQDFNLVVAGDFNAAMNNHIDRNNVTETPDQKLSSEALQSWADQVGVIDLWRTLHPGERDFSFTSGRHGTMHRIDYVFASRNLFQNTNIVMSCISLSDHKGVICQASLSPMKERAPRWRFNDTLLQNAEFCAYFEEALIAFIAISSSCGDDRIRWSLIKGHIMDKCKSFSSYLNKLRRQERSDLNRRIFSIEQSMVTGPSPDLLLQRKRVHAELEALLRLDAEFLVHRTREKHYFEGSRPSRALSISLNASENFANIAAIRNLKDELIDDPKLISVIMAEHFSNLYRSEIPFNQKLTDEFLEHLLLPKLTALEAESLDAPITLEELRKSLGEMKKGASPGVDGIPPWRWSWRPRWPAVPPWSCRLVCLQSRMNEVWMV